VKKYFLLFILFSFNSIFCMTEKLFCPAFIKGKKVYGLVKHDDGSLSANVVHVSGRKCMQDLRKKIKAKKIYLENGMAFYVACMKENCLIGFVKQAGEIPVAILTEEYGLEVLSVEPGKRFVIAKVREQQREKVQPLTPCKKLCFFSALVGGTLLFLRLCGYI